MTNFIHQTNTSLITEGEIGITNDSLVTKDGAGNLIQLSSPTGQTTIAGYFYNNNVQETMDISTVSTLSSSSLNLTFLNSPSYDALGLSNFMFQEADGTVYGLYSRTDGINQGLYLMGASGVSNSMNTSSSPYAPSWIPAGWTPAFVTGGDGNGFMLTLLNNSTNPVTFRYVYVYLSTNSLIDVANHQYVEITQMVNAAYTAAGITGDVQIPIVRRIGDKDYCLMNKSDTGVYLSAWFSETTTFPYTTTAMTGTVATYNPTQLTIAKSGFPADSSSPTTFSATVPIMGATIVAPTTLFKVINPDGTNDTNWASVIFPHFNEGYLGQLQSSIMHGTAVTGAPTGTHYLAIGCAVWFGLTTASMEKTIVYTMTATTSGTQLTLTYVDPFVQNSSYGQQYPFVVSSTSNVPNETVASVATSPLTCADKLPMCTQNINMGATVTTTANIYYSGAGSLAITGNGNAISYVDFGSQGVGQGSIDSWATLMKNWIYPLFNVSPRVNGSQTTQLALTIQPSGIQTNCYSTAWVGQNQVVAVGSGAGYSLATFPANSTAGDTTGTRDNVAVKGFKARVSEYSINYSDASNNLYTGAVWSPTTAVLTPITVAATPIRDVNPAASPAYYVGPYTLSGTTYNMPSTRVWQASASITTELATLGQNVLTTLAVPGTYKGNEVQLVLGTDGLTPIAAVGVVVSYDSANTTVHWTSYITSVTITGNVFDLATTGFSKIASYSSASALVGMSTLPGLFQIYQVWVSTTEYYVAFRSTLYTGFQGDSWTSLTFGHITNGAVTAGATYATSSYFTNVSCSAQHYGLAVFSSATFGGQWANIDAPMDSYNNVVPAALTDFATGFNNAITNAGVPTSGAATTVHMEVYNLDALASTSILQLGAISGRINHTQFSLPSTYLNFSGQASGTYYLYIVADANNNVSVQFDSATRDETATNMYFGSVVYTSGTGFSGQQAIYHLMRFGTARLADNLQSIGTSMAGSHIRIGPRP